MLGNVILVIGGMIAGACAVLAALNYLARKVWP